MMRNNLLPKRRNPQENSGIVDISKRLGEGSMHAGYYYPYWISSDENEELEHYGVKGMKWGVRRYQNYDGTYTQKGLKRFNSALDTYEKSKAKTKSLKGVNKQAYKESKGETKVAKRKLNKAYKDLKTDRLADQGKALYKQGKTITDNSRKFYTTQAAIIIGGNAASAMLANSGNLRVASLSGAAITLGGTAINATLAAKTRFENKRLRAYYAH